MSDNKLKIGVISDTHDHWKNIEKFVEKFIYEGDIEAIFHCGDIIAPFMKIPFKGLKNADIPLYAVYGNNDGERMGLKTLFGEDFIIKGDFFETEMDGKRIIVFHHLSEKMVESLAISG
ncbi:MAG: metallophosphoesterase family protein, partial [Promethearchaeota archaeon]